MVKLFYAPLIQYGVSAVMLTTDLHPRVENLIDLYKKPLTVIHKGSKALPNYLLGQDGTIAIRLTRDYMLVELISHLGKPIVSTSANLQATPSPAHYQDIDPKIKESVDYIFLDRRASTQISAASQIISYNTEGELFFLR